MGADDQGWAAWREYNDTSAKLAPAGGLVDTMARAARQYPSRPAVQGTDETLDYLELDRRATAVADGLHAAGVRPGAIVAVAAGTTTHPYVAILGVLKAGCGYLPVDAGDPPSRLRFILQDAGAAVLLARADEVPRLAPSVPSGLVCGAVGGPLPATIPGGHQEPPAAYVIYTSGTTGRPKGVRIGHDALLNFVGWFRARHELDAGDRAAQVAPLTFDPSVQQIFPAWSAGACLIPVPEAELRDPFALLDWLAAERITHLDLVTSHWHRLREAAAVRPGGCRLPDLRWIVIGGETMHYEESHDWYRTVESPARLNNIYGPTEATINATEWEVDRSRDAGQVPIGVPLPNYRLYVLKHDELCGAGETGELVIAGTGLADRYQSAEATAKAFGVLRLPDGTAERIYRSGDLARLMTDRSGALVLEFRGRTDTQVKISGYRVELEEVEAAAKSCPGITSAAVIARGDPVEQLVCFSTGPGEVGSDRMRDHLTARIPAYMVPNIFLWLDEFPVTRNGKLDRTALTAALDLRLASQSRIGGEPPRTASEQAVAAVWSQVLGLPEVGAVEDFFGLGGTSLLAASVVNRLRRQGFAVTVRDLYHAPTVRGLAGRAETGAGRAETAG